MMFETDDFLMEALFGVLRVGLASRVVAFAFFFLNDNSTELKFEVALLFPISVLTPWLLRASKDNINGQYTL